VAEDRELTPEEKQAACERICGESGKRGMHRIAPEMCPLQLDTWKNPPRKPQN
jgi:hypothetical protein